MTIIIPRIFGGIGNQLFCYSAARRLALVNNAELAIDNVSGFAYDYKYKRDYQLSHFNIPCRFATSAERLEPMSRVRRYIKRKLNQRYAFENRNYLVQEDVNFDKRILNLKPKGIFYMEGYWQSEKYFKDIEAIIRKDLQICPPTNEANLSMAKKIEKYNSIAVHVRFFDIPNSEGINNTPRSYYNQAIETMKNLISDGHYFIFSDQPKAARTLVPLPDDNITLIEINNSDSMAYADLWLMTKCKHFVLANSTFSWWGAWLSEYSQKKIIAPKFEIKSKNRVTSWGFDGLIPEEWILK